MVSVLQKELECNMKSSSTRSWSHAAKDQEQIHTSTLWINHPRSVHTKFYSGDWLMQSNILLVSNNKGRWGGADLLSSSEKEGLIREGALNKGFMVLKVLDHSFVLLEHFIVRNVVKYRFLATWLTWMNSHKKVIKIIISFWPWFLIRFPCFRSMMLILKIWAMMMLCGC